MGLFAGTKWDVPPSCDRCGKLTADCQCPPPPQPAPARVPPQKQTARLALEKRPGGKFVTVVRGLLAADNDLPALLSKLKGGCGAGGTIKDDTIEIQGQQLDRAAQLLEQAGYKVKR